MFKELYSHVKNIIDKYLQIYSHILIIFIMSKKKEKIKTKKTIKLFYYIQIYRNNDLLLQNLVNKYVLSDLLKLEMVLEFQIS